jgi:hypothetical protein
MSDQRSYSAPEIVKLGDAVELTEGNDSPNVDGQPGSGSYHNANPPRAQDEITEGI